MGMSSRRCSGAGGIDADKSTNRTTFGSTAGLTIFYLVADLPAGDLIWRN